MVSPMSSRDAKRLICIEWLSFQALSLMVWDVIAFSSDSLRNLCWDLVNREVLIWFLSKYLSISPSPIYWITLLFPAGVQPGPVNLQSSFFLPLHPEFLVDVFVTQFPSRIHVPWDYVYFVPCRHLIPCNDYLLNEWICILISGRTRFFSSKLIWQNILPYSHLLILIRMTHFFIEHLL